MWKLTSRIRENFSKNKININTNATAITLPIILSFIDRGLNTLLNDETINAFINSYVFCKNIFNDYLVYCINRSSEYRPKYKLLHVYDECVKCTSLFLDNVPDKPSSGMSPHYLPSHIATMVTSFDQLIVGGLIKPRNRTVNKYFANQLIPLQLWRIFSNDIRFWGRLSRLKNCF